MKNLIKFSFLFVILALSSCGGEEGGSSDLTDGPWNITGLDVLANVSTQIAGMNLNQTLVIVGKDFNATLDLSDDGSYDADGSYSIDQTVTDDNGNSTTTTIPQTVVFDMGSYVLDSEENPTVITLTDMDGNVFICDITSLTKTEFNFTLETVETEQTAAGTITTAASADYRFTR